MRFISPLSRAASLALLKPASLSKGYYGRILLPASILQSQRCSNSDLTRSRDYQLAMPQNLSSQQSADDTPEFSGGAYVLLAIPVIAFGLGTWQVFRWRSKLKLMAELDAKTQAPAVNFPEILSDLEDLEYQKVKLRGKFDYANETVLGPRPLTKDGPNSPKEGIIKSVRSDSGYHLITPFKVSGKNLTILVNRGWIPNRRERNFPGTKDEVEIVGIVRKHEDRPVFVNQVSGNTNLFLYRDISNMSRALSTAPVFLDLATISNVDTNSSLPIPGQTRATLRNEHVNYFITWYSLAIVTSFMWHRLFILRKPLL